MIDLHQPGPWLIAFCVLAMAMWIATRVSSVRRLVLTLLQSWGSRLWTRLTPEPTVDPLTEELGRIRRLQRLHSDIARLQRILADDAAMSATRQLGNRLAYHWLVDELSRVRQLPQSRSDERVLAGWSAALPASKALNSITDAAAIGSTSPRRPEVEILDLGWRT